MINRVEFMKEVSDGKQGPRVLVVDDEESIQQISVSYWPRQAIPSIQSVTEKRLCGEFSRSGLI